jgi:hypothetical protein
MIIQLSINPRMFAKWAICSVLILVSFVSSLAQTKVSGKVIDGETGEALPFVNVVFTGTRIGMVTDFDGFYSLSTTEPVDSITVSYIGYEKVVKPVAKGTQTINFSLFSNAGLLAEAVIRPGINPAERISELHKKIKKITISTS